jgi:hypothetical protein
MTPKEKAEELMDKFTFEIGNFNSQQSALTAVDEIINVVKKYETKRGKLLLDNINLLYWQRVKQEIENL